MIHDTASTAATSMVFPPVWIAKCSFRLQLLENDFWHCSHLNGFSSMSSNMHFQVTTCSKQFLAKLVHISLLTCMGSHMHMQLATTRKCLMTQLATVWCFASMGCYVHFQSITMTKTFLT